ncbi:MAG: substrate-binding domain-containing protein [Chromatiaceae bacterium]|nr:substrate-binding domain-containing protein [Chromatiaceae bacterium]
MKPAICRIITLLAILVFSGLALADTPVIRLATTTSTENSGLLAVLLPEFEKREGVKVHVIAVGTGKALRMGQDGDVDLVLVHAPAAEKAFVNAGYGVDRRDVMYNDFVLVGPAADPAAIAQSGDAGIALQRIAAKQALFISRGDDSGTHKKELQLWQSAGIAPAGAWYREAGQGMGKVLQMAGELDAYTLADRGTWLAYQDKSPLKVLFAGDPRMFNPYGIIAVNPQRYPDINYQGASKLIEWITSEPGQRMIGEFTISGTRLFTPSANTSQVARH